MLERFISNFNWGSFIFILWILLALWIAVREIRLWYWKQTHIFNTLVEIKNTLNEINKKLDNEKVESK